MPGWHLPPSLHPFLSVLGREQPGGSCLSAPSPALPGAPLPLAVARPLLAELPAPVSAAPAVAPAPRERPQGALCSGHRPERRGDGSRRRSRENAALLSRSHSPAYSSRGGCPPGQAWVRQLCQDRGAAHTGRSRAVPSATGPCQPHHVSKVGVRGIREQ